MKSASMVLRLLVLAGCFWAPAPAFGAGGASWARVQAHALSDLQMPFADELRAAGSWFSQARVLGLPLGLEYEPPLFRVPMIRYRYATGGIESLASGLDAFTRRLQAREETGYDWVFPKVYALVTAQELKYLREGRFRRPELVRLEVGQFYEVYAANARTWLEEHSAEPAWAAAAALSRRLAGAGIKAGTNDHKAACLAVLLQSMVAHIAVDLPRCLLIVHLADGARGSLAEMKEDFFRMTPLFDTVSAELIGEGVITPRVLAHLPPLLRRLVATLGVGRLVRLLRRYAWERFVWNLRHADWQSELVALPQSHRLSELP
ncbi:MAG: hypothetical protein HYY25_05845 [Candidatus Wallbacteria bacterium]|nr:hypothetical protein [Candidatus Wallbacteria bacterium]